MNENQNPQAQNTLDEQIMQELQATPATTQEQASQQEQAPQIPQQEQAPQTLQQEQPSQASVQPQTMTTPTNVVDKENARGTFAFGLSIVLMFSPSLVYRIIQNIPDLYVVLYKPVSVASNICYLAAVVALVYAGINMKNKTPVIIVGVLFVLYFITMMAFAFFMVQTCADMVRIDNN